MMRRFIVSLLAVGLLAGTAWADTELTAAKDALTNARRHLKSSTGDYEGHVRKALERVGEAISEVDEALVLARKDEKHDAKKAKQIDKQVDKLESKKSKLQND
jgi:hypothetical protein